MPTPILTSLDADHDSQPANVSLVILDDDDAPGSLAESRRQSGPPQPRAIDNPTSHGDVGRLRRTPATVNGVATEASRAGPIPVPLRAVQKSLDPTARLGLTSGPPPWLRRRSVCTTASLDTSGDVLGPPVVPGNPGGHRRSHGAGPGQATDARHQLRRDEGVVTTPAAGLLNLNPG